MGPKPDNYNLLEEPWIPILTADGKPNRVGIRTALTQAGKIRQIAASNPMDNVALLRLLLAILQWCKSTVSDKERKSLNEAEGIPPDWLVGQLGPSESPNTTFDLLGEGYGFLQDWSAWEEVRGKHDEKSVDAGQGLRAVSDLIQELPSGTNIAHFRHTRDGRNGLCPACSAIGLVRLSAFATASKHGKNQQKPAGLNGPTPVYAVPLSGSLLGALVLCWDMPSPDDDEPSWDKPQEPPNVHALGVKRAFTWTPRRVWLDRPKTDQTEDVCGACGERTKLIYRIVFLPGWRRPFDKGAWPRDPHVLTRPPSGGKKKAGAPEPIGFPTVANPVGTYVRSWETCYRALLHSPIAECLDRPPEIILCAGPTANQALYQDTPSHALILVSNDYAASELEWLESIDLRGPILAALPARATQRPEVKARLNDVSAALEAALKKRFQQLLLDLSRTENDEQAELSVKTWREEARRIYREALDRALSSVVPNSPLGRQDAVNHASRRLEKMLAGNVGQTV